MSHTRWAEINRRITRTVLQKISAVPPLYRAFIGFLPVVGNLVGPAFQYSEIHRIAILKLARELQRKGKLPPDAVRHLHAYERALDREQRAYNAFLKSFEKHV